MLLVSWNVNGLRACLRKGGGAWLRDCGAEAICLQEIRCGPEELGPDLLPGYGAHWHPADRPGYAGVATFTRGEPLSLLRGLGHPELDREGRLLAVELDDLYLVNVYTPNVQRDLARLPLRTEVWDPAFLAFCLELEKRKPVVFCGDLNVSHREIDLANPRANRGNAGFTDEERAGFDRILAAGYLDAFRLFEAGGGHYTWWSNRPGVRQRNVGWRIDYFVVSPRLRPRLRAAAIHPGVMGSDHCPVSVTLTRTPRGAGRSPSPRPPRAPRSAGGGRKRAAPAPAGPRRKERLTREAGTREAS
ncbi:MAG: exodeoxyribonuclease III [Candidatus Latescibacterota bacterium]